MTGIIKSDLILRFSLLFFTVNVMTHGTPMGGSSVPYHGDQ